MQSARRRLGLALALVGALVAFLATAPAAFAVKACESANATPASVSKRTIVRATLCTINSQRSDAGLGPLKLNRKLSKAARRHARDMDQRNYFSHDSLGGGSFVDRIRSAGYLERRQELDGGREPRLGHSRLHPLRARSRACG